MKNGPPRSGARENLKKIMPKTTGTGASPPASIGTCHMDLGISSYTFGTNDLTTGAVSTAT